MSDLTRRGFVRSSAGAAAGLTAIGVIGVGDAGAKTTNHTGSHHKKHKRHSDSDAVVAWIGDRRKGSITIMAGNHEVTIHDRKLVAEIARHLK